VRQKPGKVTVPVTAYSMLASNVVIASVALLHILNVHNALAYHL